MNNGGEERCPWCLGFPAYIAYHDTEWGVPSFDQRHLFEMLTLEGAQAGLSWATILRKRDAYRRLFLDFEVEAVARMTDADVDRLVQDPGIVRHRGKIEATIGNARAWMALRERGIAPEEFLWSHVDHRPRINRFRTLAEVPASTPESAAMSRNLRKKGFRFVGPTICYSFMQAVGMVNDHLLGCPRHSALDQRLAT
ncbi:DNA-3-methyladenine glycosylase I [Natronocella acetinitrilica]|uniref:DNA-3-methyladenine glycosylase I n=1 Tax=Natronocella acetinitrilica TaxID=414046 RepID=A0AAE3G549_9GAMM|nr:DNA-3-methyladenine glycosylase I [Natronocella acetinitrilica]MCP1675990.1 DNA-3-methyladenine glycosylase I [Natronocella acetinitrilica]